jgi:hypothetical protein
MLSAGFIGSAGWSNKNLPTPYPVPFGSSVFILISLVLGNDESDTSSSNRFTHGYFCSMDTGLGFQWSHLSSPLYGLMASRYRRGSAFTAAPAG